MWFYNAVPVCVMVCVGPYQRENQAALLTQSLQESPQRWIRATSSNPMQRSCAACPQAAWSWKTKGLRWEWNDHFTLLPASPVSGPHASHMDDQICCFCCCCCYSYGRPDLLFLLLLLLFWEEGEKGKSHTSLSYLFSFGWFCPVQHSEFNSG